MHKEYLMGNEAIAMGAVASGVNLVSGYPGTPSSEVLETAARRILHGYFRACFKTDSGSVPSYSNPRNDQQQFSKQRQRRAGISPGI